MIDMLNMFHKFVCYLVFYFQAFVQISILLPPFFFLFSPSSSSLSHPSLSISSYSSSSSSLYSSLSTPSFHLSPVPSLSPSPICPPLFTLHLFFGNVMCFLAHCKISRTFKNILNPHLLSHLYFMNDFPHLWLVYLFS